MSTSNTSVRTGLDTVADGAREHKVIATLLVIEAVFVTIALLFHAIAVVTGSEPGSGLHAAAAFFGLFSALVIIMLVVVVVTAIVIWLQSRP